MEMTRREFIPSVAALTASALPVAANFSLALETNGWRVTFDLSGRVTSFKNEQVELINPRLTDHSLRILYPGEAVNICDQPARSWRRDSTVIFEYHFSAPHPLQVRLETELLDCGANSVALKQHIVLQVGQAIRKRVMAQLPRPFQLPYEGRKVFLPLKNGIGRIKEIRGLDNEDNYVYELAGTCAIGRSQLLAIPAVYEYSDKTPVRLTHAADVLFTSLLRLPFGEQVGQYQWIYPGEPGLPAGKEERTFYTIAHRGAPEQSIDLFYRTSLAEVKPGPLWLHDVALISYDYLSKNGQGWFRDIQRLSELIAPVDRKKVLFVLHGWYDAVGQYTFDPKRQSLATSWVAFPSARSSTVQALGRDPDEDGMPSMLLTPGYRWPRKSVEALQPVPITQQDMHRRIRFAKERGFRVLLYFADGLNACRSSKDTDKPDRVLVEGGWEGPDTIGHVYAQNPLHGDVRAFYLSYVQALLAEYGKELDGFVWDETNTIASGSPGTVAFPGYASRAMMTLVKEIAASVSQSPNLAFLTSDNIGNFGEVHNAPYCLMAHGTYQDSHCRPEAWPYGLFPNHRNTFWSCNWASVSNLAFMKFGMDNFDTPVSIGNGAFGDDIGVSDMTEAQTKRILALFESRKQRQMEIHWIEEACSGARYGDRVVENRYNML